MAELEAISPRRQRSLAWMAQFHGAGRPAGGSPAARTAAALSRVGYAQIDTISVVERAHHHVLWSRCGDYRPPVLSALESEPRRAFEYWAHAAAYLPMEDYRFCLPRMRRIASEGHEWFPVDDRVVGWVRDRVKAEGPLRSQDFESEGARGPWWDWKPAKAALEFLFQSGELMVASRPGFQKLYDLAERVLPSTADTRCPSIAEMADWYVRRAAAALGVFTRREAAYMRKDCTDDIALALDRSVEEGLLVEAKAAGDDRGRLWADAALLGLSSRACSARLASRPARILSPFDNLVIDRKRCSRVFGLDYTLECYVTPARRAFGYFALPVFWRGDAVGLLDCKAERKAGVLRVRRGELRFAPSFETPYAEREAYPLDSPESAERCPAAPEGFALAFAQELSAYASFNGCAEIAYG